MNDLSASLNHSKPKLFVSGIDDELFSWLHNRLNGAHIQRIHEANLELSPAQPLATKNAHSTVILFGPDTLSHPDEASNFLATVPGASNYWILPHDVSPDAAQSCVHKFHADQLFLEPLDREALAQRLATRLNLEFVPSEEPGILKQQQIASSVARLWEKFRPTNHERMQILMAAAEALKQGKLDSDLRQQAAHEAHKMAGAAGSFGFAEASNLAHSMERILLEFKKLGSVEVDEYCAAAEKLKYELGRPPRALALHLASQHLPSLLIVQGAGRSEQRLLLAAAGRGLETALAINSKETRNVLSRRNFDVVLFDPTCGPRQEVRTLMAEFASRDLPVLIYTGDGEFEDRTLAVRLGARGFLQRSQPIPEVLDSVLDFLEHSQKVSYQILCVDDDASIIAALDQALTPHQIQVTGITDPLEFWAKMQTTAPDLVILDLILPHISGIELCKLMRHDSRWREVPVLFLTIQSDSATVERIFKAGADDFVHKPFTGPELLARVQNRLERTRLQREMAERDPLTGLGNRRQYGQLMGHFLHLAERRSQPLSLVVLDLDGFKLINDAHGHAVGDEVLRRLGEVLLRFFRSEDMVARWGGDEFVVGMYGMLGQDSEQRIHSLAEVVEAERFIGPDGQRLPVAFSYGIAQYPDDGLTAHELYLAADRKLYLHKAARKGTSQPA